MLRSVRRCVDSASSLGIPFVFCSLQVVPKIGWQIDPFGHSSTQSQIFADLGMEAIVINRVDFNDLATRKAVRSFVFQLAIY